MCDRLKGEDPVEQGCGVVESVATDQEARDRLGLGSSRPGAPKEYPEHGESTAR